MPPLEELGKYDATLVGVRVNGEVPGTTCVAVETLVAVNALGVNVDIGRGSGDGKG